MGTEGGWALGGDGDREWAPVSAWIPLQKAELDGVYLGRSSQGAAVGPGEREAWEGRALLGAS